MEPIIGRAGILAIGVVLLMNSIMKLALTSRLPVMISTTWVLTLLAAQSRINMNQRQPLLVQYSCGLRKVGRKHMALQNGMADNTSSKENVMKNCIAPTRIICFMAIILSSCVSARNYSDDIMSPTEEKVSAEMTKKLDDYDPVFFDAVDTEQMRMFSLGEYYIFQSILRGPTGLGSNFYYYLLVKKDFSIDIYFMSLSREIKNIWKKGNSLFIDLLDFCTESYFDGEYSDCDSCVFISFHTELSTSSFSLDTISSEKQYLSWGDIKSWESLLR